MRILSRSIFREIAVNATLGLSLLTFVLFLQRLSRLFEIMVRSSAPPSMVLHLFLLAIPFTLPYTIPLAVLVGTLIALSRMAGDGEIVALRAAGVPSRSVMPPVMALALVGFAITAVATLWLTPWSQYQTDRTLNRMVAEQLTAEVQPRVFEEQFPNTILYVGEVIPEGGVFRWRNIFMADLTPPDSRKSQGHESGDLPRITVATSALAVPDAPHNRIQLSMHSGSTFDVGKAVTDFYSTRFQHGEELLEAQRPSEVRIIRAVTELDTIPLYRFAYKDKDVDPTRRIEARIEFHERLALPLACILLALLGVPLGVSSRRGGKSTAFVLTLGLAFFYYMGLITLIGLARQRTLPTGLAVWLPDIVFATIGLVLISRLDVPGDRDWMSVVRMRWTSLIESLRGVFPVSPDAAISRMLLRVPFLPQLVDTYVLSSFLFYFVVLLVSLVTMAEVFTFFELLSDIIRNHIAMARVGEYLFFLGPHLIYDSVPVSVLVAVLICFGLLTKYNEVTAFKASGVSLYRMSVPILLASGVLSGGLFAFDHYYVPGANQRQDAIRNEIKGRPPQSSQRADRKWILGGKGSRIFYYKYFDPAQRVMAGVNVYEVDPATFRLVRYIAAERAHWEPQLNLWIFENGWSRDTAVSGDTLNDFTGKVASFAELNEGPDYFLKEVVPSKQMNFQQLSAYINELQQGGFDTVSLQVQFYEKFSVPLFALIMALISTPFAFLTGNRGAMAGVGVSLGIAFTYWSVSALFEQLGDVNLLPAAVAAWSPDALFALAGLYFYSRMRT
ncbi:MAG TPA: LptF/LptG family permease [Bryobacteraceae bacterium]|nr:LptF/LptG family permease [Bryobacteraceae bacterium]